MKIKLLAVHIALILSSSAFAEGIATDGTMGVAQTLSGSNVSIPQTLGSTVGNNLFHSFSDFNIDKGQTVTFTGADNLQNVISRVTGDNKSIIDGTLKSEIKNADFYFINPNGITFNEKTSVDVPAAFHVTTADKMDFGKNGGVFFSDKSKQSTLSSELPSALGFLGTSKVNNGLIDFNNTHLKLHDTKTIDVVAGQISIKGDEVKYDDNDNPINNIKIPSGNMRFVSMQGKGDASLIKNSDGVLALPEITFSNSTAGNIIAGNIIMDGSYIDTSGDVTDAGTITLKSKNIDLIGSTISSNAVNPTSTDKEGNNVTILTNAKAGNITLDASENIKLDASKNIKLDNFITKNTDSYWSHIDSYTSTNGDAGTIILKGKNIDLIGSTILSNSTNPLSTDKEGNNVTILTNAKAGNITLDASENIKLDSFITKNTDGNESSYWSYIDSYTDTNGDAGTITLKGKNIDLVGSLISSNAMNPTSADKEGILTNAKAGNITLDASENINSYWSHIDSYTSTNGNAGTIILKGKNIDLIGSTILSNSTNPLSTDKEGNNVTILTNAKAGDITLDASENIKLDSFIAKNTDGNESSYWSYIGSNTDTNGDAGTIILKGKNLDVEGGHITSASHNSSIINDYDGTFYSKGNGGNLSVVADSIKIDGKDSEITASTQSNGTGGKVDIQAKKLEITNNASITAGSLLGEVKENSSGKTGNITVNADELTLSNGGKIDNENQSTVEDATSITPGTITINAPKINIKNAEITSASLGNVDAGSITINSSNLLKLTDNAFINATSFDGNGGTVTIGGHGIISLQNSGIKTIATGETSNGGNVIINSDVIVMDGGMLLASTIGGIGGNIDLNLQPIIPSSNSLLTVGSKLFNWKPYTAVNVIGVSGTVSNSTPPLNLSGVLANINSNNFNNRLISQNYCAVNKGSSLSKKGKGGLPLRPKDLQVY